MADNIALWHAEHVNFGNLLDLLERQLDVFHRGDAPNYELMLDIMHYMTHYPDLFHHPMEDLAFERIRERESNVRKVIDELMQQHVLLKQSGEELLGNLDAIVDGSILARESVERPCRTYIANFRSHIQMEETEILPAASRVLGDKDWTAIYVGIYQREDPLFGKRTERRYAAIRKQIAREAE